MTRREPLRPGDRVPEIRVASTVNPTFHFDTIAGRYVALLFFGSTGADGVPEALQAALRNAGAFAAARCTLIGVSMDAGDRDLPWLRESFRNHLLFWDFDGAMTRAVGLIDPAGPEPFRPTWVLLDPMLRCLGTFALAETHVLLRTVAALPSVDDHAGVPVNAPVLILPRVFDAALCRDLIDAYERDGGGPSGFMREIDGRTIGIMDPTFKRRRDAGIDDQDIRARIRRAISGRLLPEIKRSFCFEATRMERYIVACYDSADRGFFRPHRDNTSKGTAHRRFAVTINLNAEDYTGGDLRFPEFGIRTYRAPTGGAVVFSCNLLHEATPVLTGRRYAFLPFLYDDAAAVIRKQNLRFIGPEQAEPTGTEALAG